MDSNSDMGGYEYSPTSVPRVPQEHWNPKAQLEALMFEAQMDGGDTTAATSRILREHALIAAQSICHLSAYASTERIRLQASQYIVDRVLNREAELDLQIQKEQTRAVGQALYATLRTLGLRYGFDVDDPEVRSLAHDTLVQVAAHGSNEKDETES